MNVYGLRDFCKQYGSVGRIGSRVEGGGRIGSGVEGGHANIQMSVDDNKSFKGS